jgi:hypothetical protein
LLGWLAMNAESTTHKAEGLRENQKRKAEMLKAEIGSESIPQLDDDEQLVLDTIMRAIRGLRNCGRPRVADIARQWERIFNYRIQVTMQERQRRAKANLVRMQVAAALNAEGGVRNEKMFGGTPNTAPESGALPKGITSGQSNVHIRLSVSPNRG